uniref:Uncharacterized protein n=1 Tax=Acrobeloides nanus TaxID=290746 RepID=A0A914D6C2_9BILA
MILREIPNPKKLKKPKNKQSKKETVSAQPVSTRRLASSQATFNGLRELRLWSTLFEINPNITLASIL